MDGDVYKSVYNIDGIILTSVVVNQDEFDRLCDDLEKLHVIMIDKPGDVDAARAAKEDIDKIRDAHHLPLMARGIKTEPFFTRYDVSTDKMTVIVRGYGKKVAETIFNMGMVTH